MENKAQAGLEYLMTYGWALVLVATVVGSLVLLFGNTADEGFKVSDPTSFLLKGSTVIGDQMTVKLQNTTGGEIRITDLLTSGYTGCTINSHDDVEGITISPGGEIEILCTRTSEGEKTISIEYEDQLGLEDTVTVTGSGSSTPLGPGGETICDDGFDNDGDGKVDCADPNCHGAQGTGGTCEYQEELTCNDSFDNDADTFTDCLDEDCYENPACEEEVEICDVTGDEDNDGKADCLDEDCLTGTTCDTGKICYEQTCQTGRVLTDCEQPAETGIFLLDQDITYDDSSTSNSDCFIMGSNRTFDCQGHSITATGGTLIRGIGTRLAQNTTIKNCVINTPNNTAIYASIMQGGSIENVTVTNSGGGIILRGASNTVLNNNVFCNNTVYDIDCYPNPATTVTGTNNQADDFVGTCSEDINAVPCS